MKRSPEQFWQKYSKTYTSFMQSHGAAYEDIINHLYPNLDKDSDVLELACGTGQLSVPLSGRVRKWLATDFSESMIQEAKKQPGPKQLSYEIADATRLPYKSASFDVVVICNSLHIIENADQAMSEIKRVLKPGGTLYAPNFLWSSKKFSHFRQHLFHQLGYKIFHRWNKQQYVSFVRSCGFLITRHEIIPCHLAPICYLEARTSFHSYSDKQ